MARCIDPLIDVVLHMHSPDYYDYISYIKHMFTVHERFGRYPEDVIKSKVSPPVNNMPQQ